MHCSNLHHSVPEAALNLKVDVRTVHSLTVTWDVPMSGGLTGYTVNVEERTGSEQTIQDSAPRIVTFNGGLSAGTQYTVILVTVSGDQNSKPIQKTFHTSKFKDITLFC